MVSVSPPIWVKEGGRVMVGVDDRDIPERFVTEPLK
jgi:hypothetical protein